MSTLETNTTSTVRDAQWYRDYYRISEEIKMKLYRYVCDELGVMNRFPYVQRIPKSALQD